MRNKKNDSAQALFVAFVFLIGMVVASVSLYQATVVPAENKQKEFEHQNRVNQEILSLNEKINSAGLEGESYVQTIKLGLRYKQGFVLGAPVPRINPPPPAGQIKTEQMEANYKLSGFNVPYNTTTDCSSDKTQSTCFPTKRVVYDISYNNLENSPTKYIESTVLYNRNENGQNITQSNQRIIDSNTIYLPQIVGNISTSTSSSTNIYVKPVTKPESVVISSKSSTDNPKLTIPTKLSAEKWRNMIDNNKYDKIEQNSNSITITLSDIDWRLVRNRVKLTDSLTNNTRLNISEITVEPKTTQITNNTTKITTLRVEARDIFGNPAQGVLINMTSDYPGEDEFIGPNGTNIARTGGDGTIYFDYRNTEEIENDTTVTFNATRVEDN